MPCTYDGGQWTTEKALDKLTRMICNQCKHLEKTTDTRSSMTDELYKWWQSHQEIDRKRIEQEKQSKKIEFEKDLKEFNRLKKKLKIKSYD